MSESTTAQIIMFPTRALASETVAPVVRAQPEPTEAEARLTRALIGLNEAVTAQRAAIAAWKSSTKGFDLAATEALVRFKPTQLQ